MLLQAAGYRTIHVGKAHFGAQGTPGADPRNLGYDVNVAGHHAGGPGSYYGKYNFSAAWRSADRIWDVPGLKKYHGQEVYLTEALTREANAAIAQAVADQKPFFLYMAHYAIHAPFEADPRFLEKYQNVGLKGMQATWASMIESMDQSLGDIREQLTKLGVADNTIVLFMSDNGSPREAPANRPLRGHKLTAYEGGIREPMLVYWPGVTKPGSVCEQYLIIEDFFPTILELAGVDDYRQTTGPIDGVSFVESLRGNDKADSTRPIFWHYPHVYDQPPFSAVRKGAWKLIYIHATRRFELYHLRDDLSEQHNLADDQPEKVQELATILAEHLVATKAQMPTDRRTGTTIPLPVGVAGSGAN
jgi:arylsulfatase A-like enzyme